MPGAKSKIASVDFAHALYYEVSSSSEDVTTVELILRRKVVKWCVGKTWTRSLTHLRLGHLPSMLPEGSAFSLNILPSRRVVVERELPFTKAPFHVQLTLDSWPDGFANLVFDSMIASPGHVGAGFQLRENIIFNNRGRGMLIKAGDGVIEGNTIVRPTFWPIQVIHP